MPTHLFFLGLYEIGLVDTILGKIARYNFHRLYIHKYIHNHVVMCKWMTNITPNIFLLQ